MKNVNDLKISIYSYLLLVFVIMTVRFFAGCTELPSKSEGPDNPLDPSNPANSIEGPALILSPTQIDINRGENFQLELWIVEANAVAGMSTRIIFDHEIFNVEKVDELGEGYVIHFDSSSVDSSGTGSESFLLQNDGELIFLYDIDTENGYIDIDCAVVEGTPRDVTGSGPVARITFKHLTESTMTNAQLEISENSLFSNSNSDTTLVKYRLESQVYIK